MRIPEGFVKYRGRSGCVGTVLNVGRKCHIRLNKPDYETVISTVGADYDLYVFALRQFLLVPGSHKKLSANQRIELTAIADDLQERYGAGRRKLKCEIYEGEGVLLTVKETGVQHG